MQTINARDITVMALTETDGLKLRAAIEETLKKDEAVTLDFSGISLFATMFFNASIGHLIMTLSPKKCDELIHVVNISDLGMETYIHSFENAKAIYEQYGNLRKIVEVTTSNIDNS
jgi:hypothetical protein